MTGNASLDPTRMPNCTGEVGEAAASCNQVFSHQIKLVPVEGETVPPGGVPWSFHFENPTNNQQGETDPEGKSAQVVTSRPERFFALVGKLAESYRKRGGSFGTLTHVEERKIALVTAPQYPVKELPYCSGYDYITVVGARTAPRDWRWQGGYGLTVESKGNQYRFINCGLRQLKDFPPASRDDYSVQRIMVVFQQGYTENDVANINKYTKEHNARIVYVKNKAELISFLNKRKDKKRLIRKMVFFCHGIINITSFHYAGDNEEAGELTIEDVRKIHEMIFDYNAEVVTYACRAGISVDENDLTGKDAGQARSPAQNMANAWDISVHAFEMRSSYVGIYGTKDEIENAQKYDEVIRSYETALDEYYRRVAQGDENVKKPERPENYDENVARHIDVKVRNENQKNGGPIAPNGAWRFPVTGNSPTGLKKGLQLYQPKEWNSC